jgi:DMSO/TMAO reductase YedYZ molybdopterin-dependent catalytic subunit
MRTARRDPVWATVAVIALLAMLSPAGCAGAAEKPTALKGVEVRQYQGQRLDAIAGFRENSIKGPQNVDRTTYRLKVDGAVARPAAYTYEQVLTRETTHTKVVELDCVEGWSVKILWEGVLLSELIDRSGPQTGAVTVVFHAVDGYTTSMPLAYVRSRDILLAYKMNGVEIPPERGFPFMVVAEDKWGYKWCKWVDEIELSSSASYLGYWESRGYSPEGDLSKPSFGP